MPPINYHLGRFFLKPNTNLICFEKSDCIQISPCTVIFFSFVEFFFDEVRLIRVAVSTLFSSFYFSGGHVGVLACLALFFFFFFSFFGIKRNMAYWGRLIRLYMQRYVFALSIISRVVQGGSWCCRSPRITFSFFSWVSIIGKRRERGFFTFTKCNSWYIVNFYTGNPPHWQNLFTPSFSWFGSNRISQLNGCSCIT